jgi:hypothetical protein
MGTGIAVLETARVRFWCTVLLCATLWPAGASHAALHGMSVEDQASSSFTFVSILNLGKVPATVTVRFHDEAGVEVGHRTVCGLAPGSVEAVATAEEGGPSAVAEANNFVGSVSVVADVSDKKLLVMGAVVYRSSSGGFALNWASKSTRGLDVLDAECSAGPTPTPTEPPAPCGLVDKCVFVTSLRYTGNLGGVAGADMLCQQRATAAGLPGSYKAWLSDSTQAASARLTHASVPYRRVDGSLVANNWSDLTDGTIGSELQIDENGSLHFFYVWTGTTSAGTLSTPTCADWTDSGEGTNGRWGSGGSLDAVWTEGSTQACSTQSPIYCFQQ